MILVYSIIEGQITFNDYERKIIKYTKNNEYIYDVLNTLFKIKNIKRCSIEIQLSNKLLQFDKKSIKTFMIILEDKESKLLVSNNFNAEKYKYKNYDETDNSLITTIKKNKIIVYDNDNIVKEFGECHNNTETKILYINVFDDNEGINHAEEEWVKLFDKIKIDKMTFGNDIITDEFFENIVYNDGSSDSNNYEMKTVNVENIYVSISFTDDKNEFIKTTYGLDLLPFFNKNIEVSETNKLFRNKLYKNVLSNHICNWIICEYETKKYLTTNSIYNNYDNMLNLKNIPSLISYILYFSSFLLKTIYNDYEIKNTDNFYYDEIFICKYTGNNTGNNSYNSDKDKAKFYEKRPLNTDNSVFSINIQLNDDGLFIGNRLCILNENHAENDLIMDDDDGIVIEQGDAIVYNGRKKRTSGSIIAGSKYVLVIFMKIKI
jgi:hypothetical protein